MMIKIGKKAKWGLFFIVLLFAIVIVSAYKHGANVTGSPVVQWVSHTEYWSSSGPGATEVASTIVRLTDYKGDPFNVDSCTVTILYPDKSVYLQDKPMAASPVGGNWYRTDPIPDAEGTYEQGVTCLYGGGKSIKTSQSFHVNPALNYIKTVDANIVAADSKLSDVNLTIVGKVQDAKSEINTNINVSSATLSNLMGLINSSLSGQLVDVKGNLNTKMSNVQAVIQGEIEGVNTTIVSRISLSETNLMNLIDNVNNNLSNQLVNAQANLDSKISNVNVSLTGIMDTMYSAYGLLLLVSRPGTISSRK